MCSTSFAVKSDQQPFKVHPPAEVFKLGFRTVPNDLGTGAVPDLPLMLVPVPIPFCPVTRTEKWTSTSTSEITNVVCQIVCHQAIDELTIQSGKKPYWATELK